MLNLVLSDAVSETDRIRVMRFADTSGRDLPDYTPGAHLEFDLGEKGRRSYSLIDWAVTSAPPATYTIAVQREENGLGGSSAMHDLQIGATISATEPDNDFELGAGPDPVLLLAGGIGITPLISMASTLAHTGRTFQFHYTARSSAVMGFQEKLAEAFSNQMTFHFDDENKIDLSHVMAQQPPGSQIYLCGPKGMIEAARTAATTAGHTDDRIHVELFSAPDTQPGDQPFEVEIHDTGEVFNIPAGKTIIEVLEAAGKDLMYDCQRGDCGICQTEVISGTPDHRDVVLSKADSESGKVMQICVSRSKSPRLVLDL